MNANLFTRKIEMCKSEAKAAGKIGSEKFKELREYMEAYPGYEIEIMAPSKRKVEFKGLTYDYMKEYISKNANDNGKTMTEFRVLIAQDKKDNVEGSEHLEATNYIAVKKWFLKRFPEIENFKKAHEKKIQDILSAV